MERYRHSGKAASADLLRHFGLMLLVAVAAGGLYWLSNCLLRIAPCNGLLPPAFGLLLAYVAKSSGRKFKIRSNEIVAFSAFLAGVVALYLAWGFMLCADLGFVTIAAFDPRSLWSYIEARYVVGIDILVYYKFHEIKEHYQGVFLAACWITETISFLGTAGWIAHLFFAETPFCERCQCWTAVQDGWACLSLESADEEARARIAQGDSEPLAGLEAARGDESDFLNIALAQCPECGETAYVSLRKGVRPKTEDGRIHTNCPANSRFYAISSADLEMLAEIRDGAVYDPPEMDRDTEADEAMENELAELLRNPPSKRFQYRVEDERFAVYFPPRTCPIIFTIVFLLTAVSAGVLVVLLSTGVLSYSSTISLAVVEFMAAAAAFIYMRKMRSCCLIEPSLLTMETHSAAYRSAKTYILNRASEAEVLEENTTGGKPVLYVSFRAPLGEVPIEGSRHLTMKENRWFASAFNLHLACCRARRALETRNDALSR